MTRAQSDKEGRAGRIRLSTKAGGVRITANHHGGGLFKPGGWKANGEYGRLGYFPTLGGLKAACERAALDKRKRGVKNRGGAKATTDETTSVWALLGLVPAKQLKPVKAAKVKPPDSVWRIFG